MTKQVTGTRGFLGTLDIFKGLTPVQLADVEQHMTERRFRKGEVLFHEGDPAHFVWFVKEGRVKAVKHMPGGRDLAVCAVGKGSLFGTCCCFASQMHPCNAEAEVETVVWRMPMADFSALMRKYPAIATGLVEHLSVKLRAAKKQQSLDQEPVERRLIHALLLLHSEFGDIIPLTRRQIAEMVGTTVETCIRTMKKLERLGYLRSERGKIYIRELAGLERNLEEDETLAP